MQLKGLEGGAIVEFIIVLSLLEVWFYMNGPSKWLLLNCAPVRPGTPLRAPTRPVLKNIRKSYNLMFKGSFTL